MRLKLAGHGLQLLGYTLSFCGLGVAVAAMVASSSYPAVPFWMFLAVAFGGGAPLMIAGGRIDARGRGIVLDQTPAETTAHYRKTTVLMAAYVTFLLAIGFVAALPLFVRATGLAHPSNDFYTGWLVAWLLVFCAGRQWVTRPLWLKIQQRVLMRHEVSSVNRSTEVQG